jgi:hypothetical protein
MDGKHQSRESKHQEKPTRTTENLLEVSLNIKEAFELALNLKSKVMNSNSFVKYKSRITRFQKWLFSNGFKKGDSIRLITKKHVIQCLNDVLHSSSPRNRNNTRTDLSVLSGNTAKG